MRVNIDLEVEVFTYLATLLLKHFFEFLVDFVDVSSPVSMYFRNALTFLRILLLDYARKMRYA